jgi:hypothetical protein
VRKTACVFVLIASICFQGVALAKQVLAWDRGGEGATHSVLHAGGVTHHHHEDGSVHKDTSPKSKQHVQNDGCASVAGLPPSDSGAVVAMNPSQPPAAIIPEGHGSPFLEGLKRPPRALA